MTTIVPVVPAGIDPRLADPAQRPDQAPRADRRPPVPTDFGVPVRGQTAAPKPPTKRGKP